MPWSSRKISSVSEVGELPGSLDFCEAVSAYFLEERNQRVLIEPSSRPWRSL
jgi:hypothetical protein